MVARVAERLMGDLERRGIPRRGFTRDLGDKQCIEITNLYASGILFPQLASSSVLTDHSSG